VVLDLAGEELVSSAFVGHLIRAHQAATASGGRLRVCCPDGPARRVLSECNLDRVLPVFATLPEALADFDPPAG
jgi:anti-anti-sigma factor